MIEEIADDAAEQRTLTVEEKLLEAARHLLDPQGFGVQLGITFEEVIREAKVPRTTAYRVWEGKDGFESAILMHLASPEWLTYTAIDSTAEALIEAYRGLGPIAPGDMTGRRERVELMVNVGAKRNLDEIIGTQGWAIYASMVSSAAPKTVPGLAEKLQAGERAYIDQMNSFYRLLARVVGLREREGLSYEHLSVAGAAFVEGMALRRVMMPDVLETTTTWHGLEWTEVSLGFLGLVDQFMESDPDWLPPDDTELEQALGALKALGTYRRRWATEPKPPSLP